MTSQITSNEYIDVSVAISPQLPIWPNSQKVDFSQTSSLISGDTANDTTVTFGVHTGTHVDAPSHFVVGAKSIEQLSLDTLIGNAYVVRVPDTVNAITSDVLQSFSIPKSATRLLFHTRNSKLWRQPNRGFDPNFVAFTAEAAKWVVARGVQLVGIDYLSIQRFYDGPETHQILLGAEVVVVEGLDLSDVKSGFCELICLPIKLKGVEGAPARVLLRY